MRHGTVSRDPGRHCTDTGNAESDRSSPACAVDTVTVTPFGQMSAKKRSKNCTKLRNAVLCIEASRGLSRARLASLLANRLEPLLDGTRKDLSFRYGKPFPGSLDDQRMFMHQSRQRPKAQPHASSIWLGTAKVTPAPPRLQCQSARSAGLIVRACCRATARKSRRDQPDLCGPFHGPEIKSTVCL